jgi:hypothetical protein
MQKLTVALIGPLLAAGTAVAGDPPDFTSVDANRDGYVSRDEARAEPQIMSIFASVDADRDNQLSTAEFMDAVKQLQG